MARVTVREMLRRKVQVNLLLFGVALVVASYAASLLTVGEMHRIIVDLGLTAMEFIGTLLAVFLGSSVIAGDVERRVIAPIVAKPVSRTQYVVGRYLGLAAVLLLNLAVMAAALAAVVAVADRADRSLAAAVAMQGVQLLVVAAIAVLFSCATSSTLAAIFALAIALAGHLTNDMRALWNGGLDWLPRLLWYALPNLGSLSLNAEAIYRQPVPSSAFIAALYGLLYASAALALATLAFERRDLK